MMDSVNPVRESSMSTVAVDSHIQPWDEQRLALVASWRRSNPGRLPRMNRHDRVEAHICQWLAAQNRRGSLITTAEVGILSRVFPEWRRVRVDTFDIYLYETCVFIDANDRFPDAKSDISTERRLGEWLARKASRGRDGTLLLSEVRALTDAIPEWRSASPGAGRVVPMPKRSEKPVVPRQPRATWEDRMQQLEDFYSDAHRTPLRTKPDEQVLAKWLMTQQNDIASGKLSIDRTHRILRVLTDNPVISFNPNPESFTEWLSRLAEHYQRNSISSMQYPHDGPRGLWEWVESMNVFYYRDELTTDQIRSLDAVDTTWRERRRGK